MPRKNEVIAKIGLADDIKARRITPKKAAKIHNAISEVEAIPSDKLLGDYRIKSVGNNLYSYRIDSNSRIIFGEKDNSRVILDIVDTGMVRVPHHGGLHNKTHKSSTPTKKNGVKL